MKKEHGIHLYININNLNNIIAKEEQKAESLKATFHAVDTFIAAFEKFAQYYPDISVIEKFTTSRIHIYITQSESKDKTIEAFLQTVIFARALASCFKEIGKYRNIDEFKVGLGADFGVFTEYSFSDPDSDIEELTTIGTPANRAAKLQSNSGDGEIVISKRLFDILPDDIKDSFFGSGNISSRVSLKYTDLTAYSSKIRNLAELVRLKYDNYSTHEQQTINFSKERANNTNLGDVEETDARSPIDYEQLSLRNSKKIYGVMLYSDIRGFTNKVEHSNLGDIKQLTKTVLEGMNRCVRDEDGIHIQFQGDRESGVFHNYLGRENSIELSAVLSAMRMLDLIDEINVERNTDKLDIGIGCAVGNIYLTRLGLKGSKFNISMGQTVREADKAEDDIAGAIPGYPKTEIAITSQLYKNLVSSSNIVSKSVSQTFKLRGDYYISTTRFSQLNNKPMKSLASNPLSTYGVPSIPHKRTPPWVLPKGYSVIINAKVTENGVCSKYKSNQYGLNKEVSIDFIPFFSVQQPYRVKWQITNTGYEASTNECLRGDSFENSDIEFKNGCYTGKHESTAYSGRHIVQCFVIKNGQCMAKSEEFIVWVK